MKLSLKCPRVSPRESSRRSLVVVKGQTEMFKRIQKLDWRIMHFVAELERGVFFRKIMKLLTTIGNGGIVWFVVILCLFVFKINLRAASAMLLALTLSLLIGNVFLKNLIQRERPFQQNPNIEALISPPSDHSCPSGHAYSSFSAAVALICATGWVATPALLLACAIAYSRVYFCVHFPSDIFSSFLLGIGTGVIAFQIL